MFVTPLAFSNKKMPALDLLPFLANASTVTRADNTNTKVVFGPKADKAWTAFKEFLNGGKATWENTQAWIASLMKDARVELINADDPKNPDPDLKDAEKLNLKALQNVIDRFGFNFEYHLDGDARKTGVSCKPENIAKISTGKENESLPDKFTTAMFWSKDISGGANGGWNQILEEAEFKALIPN
ncbi:MAG: hypothetical protein V4691_07455 [Pseudomonadota bacterium]